MNNNDGLLLIFSGPSGAGKGTVLKELLNGNDNMKLSVSATTRTPRDRKSTRLNSSHYQQSRMPSSA